jgi:hypothetical protein
MPKEDVVEVKNAASRTRRRENKDNKSGKVVAKNGKGRKPPRHLNRATAAAQTRLNSSNVGNSDVNSKRKTASNVSSVGSSGNATGNLSKI